MASKLNILYHGAGFARIMSGAGFNAIITDIGECSKEVNYEIDTEYWAERLRQTLGLLLLSDLVKHLKGKGHNVVIEEWMDELTESAPGLNK